MFRRDFALRQKPDYQRSPCFPRLIESSIVHPRETFKATILANAAAVIFAHNYPSGGLTPSRADQEIARMLKEAGELLGIRVLDHVIVDTETGRQQSFVNIGILLSQCKKQRAAYATLSWLHRKKVAQKKRHLQEVL